MVNSRVQFLQTEGRMNESRGRPQEGLAGDREELEKKWEVRAAEAMGGLLGKAVLVFRFERKELVYA